MSQNKGKCRYKLDRRTGVNIFSTTKSPIHTRNYPAGQHGKTARRTNSEYGKRLMEVAKLRKFYGDIKFSYLKSVFKAVSKQHGRTDDYLIGVLESRLAQIVYRAKWAPSPFMAKQLVSHKHILVNGRIVNIASYRVCVNDVIELIPEMRTNHHVSVSLNNNARTLPTTMVAETPTKIRIISDCNTANTSFGFALNLQSVVEFMSRYI